MSDEKIALSFGSVVDCSREELIALIVKSKMNAGELLNLKNLLTDTWCELKARADLLIKGITPENRDTHLEAIQKLYAELLKLEDKVLFIQDYLKTLVVDTP